MTPIPTPEILPIDRERAKEAHRLARVEGDRREWEGMAGVYHDAMILAAAIGRTNYQPVDPDLIRAREIVAEELQADGHTASAAYVERGDRDDQGAVRAVLRALKDRAGKAAR